MLDPQSENEKLFVGYWAKMLARYAGLTEEEYEEIARRRREEKIGRCPR